VSPTLAVTAVKAQIVATYNLDAVNTKALFLLGHIPVPYSGDFGPDGHPDHQGAWPTDVYYADVNGNWTDVSVTSTTVSPARTQNVPGDGKFDQSIIPSPVELQVGRVDLYGMTSFTATETQLLQNYLNKDHDYRKKVFAPIKRAVLDDNFGYFPAQPYGGESFASSGFKNFGPLVTPTNVAIADYFTSMTGNSYQWSYGCGGGTFNSAGGIGATSNFAASDLQGVFTMLFGSYFGDWDVNDNFLRAPLCQGKTLTNAWAGRPNWMFHHMAMGENIGYSAKLTQNNTTTYFPSPYPLNYGLYNVVSINLMGDPTLRNDIVAPVSSVVATVNGNNCNITWAASTETNILGYNIYMKNDTNKTYIKINPSVITGTNYTDNCLLYPGIYKYMVRTLKLETTPSGTYYNLSEGIADTAYNSSNLVITAQYTNTVNSNTITFINSITNANSFSWDFGNGSTSTATNPSITYTDNCNYTVTLVASNNCYSYLFSTVVNLNSLGINAQFTNAVTVYTVVFNNTSTNASAYSWDFGDGGISNAVNPVYTYSANGNYTVTLIATNHCETDTFKTVINITDVGINKISLTENYFNLYPNPASSIVTLKNDGCENCSLAIFNSEGKQIYFKSNVNDNLKIDVSGFKRGLYLVKLIDKENRSVSKKLVID